MKVTEHRRALLALYAMGLLVITLAPLPAGGEYVEAVPGLDKLIHVVLFGGLAFLLMWNAVREGRARAFIKVFGLTVAAAGLIELMQDPLPYRSGDVWDFLAGAVGALIGAAVARAMLGPRPHRPPSTPPEH
jgi:VanZ family protein